MKFEDIIIEMIKHEVDELDTKDKDLVGKGAFHNVYISKKNPNVVYKIGFDEDVNGWVDIFKSRPDLFPKVYKMGHLNIKLKNLQQHSLGEVVILNQLHIVQVIPLR